MGVLKGPKLLPPIDASPKENTVFGALLRAIEKRNTKKLRAFERKAEIRGMLLVLNKVYWKIPKEWAEYAIAEASDIPGMNGHFAFDPKKEAVVFRLLKRD